MPPRDPVATLAEGARPQHEDTPAHHLYRWVQFYRSNHDMFRMLRMQGAGYKSYMSITNVSIHLCTSVYVYM
ncbi:hypothetical protein ANCCAN_05189 [Ancylostoma caninum]|uniref:Uncharacterized protein n=1 Tax=Ancylostoma caninum TaxID=29170 RepID=A0A368H0C8_ANCCA|nr:hypothetical protein ANCCAN_05189 [Ancylostoma caninum]